jgi:ribonuclease HI
VLTDFVAEWTVIQTPPAPIEHETWIMYFDGSIIKEGAGLGLVFISPLGVCMEYMVRLHFPASNNVAEYKALINDLRIAVGLGIHHLEIRGDSELIVDQVMKEKNYVDPKMAVYCQAIPDLEGKFHGLEIHHVLRDYNKVVDVLAKTASSRKLVPHGVFASDEHAPSVRADGEKLPNVEGPEVMAIDQPPDLNLEDPDWHFPILEWLVEGKLLSDQMEARHIARRAKMFVLIEGELYKRGAAGILMRCILGDQGRELLCEIHVGPRTLVGKAKNLLAHSGGGLQGHCASLRGVPILRSTNSPPGASTSNDRHHVAFHHVAPRHGRAAPRSSRGLPHLLIAVD